MVPGEKVSVVMFCKQFLAYAVYIEWCYHSNLSINIQVGLNMLLYDYIGDASLSLRGRVGNVSFPH